MTKSQRYGLALFILGASLISSMNNMDGWGISLVLIMLFGGGFLLNGNR
jgi:hypothetical protein